MAYNIGPKIGIDGEKEFRQSLRNINDEYKALEAESRSLASAMDAQGDEQQKLVSHSKQLEKQIDAQKRKMTLLEDALKKTSDLHGENSIQAIRLRGALYDTQATISNLEGELRGTNAEMVAFSSEALELAEKSRLLDEAETSLNKQIRDLESAYKAIQSESKMLSATYASNENESKNLEIQTEQLAKQLDNQRQKASLLVDAVSNASEKYGENSSEANRLRASLYDTQATISNLENELTDTSKRLENMAEGFEDVGQEAGQAEGAVLDFADVVGANLLGDLASDALQAMGDAVADFAKGMPEAAAEVKAASSQFEQAFGEMEGSARNALEGIADETGITASRMQESFTGIFSFSKTMGADSAAALDLSSRAMLAAADSAAYYDKSIEEATETLQSFLKGNYEHDAALGISATETVRNTAANELYAKSFNELSESQKVDVLLSMVEAGNAASGALGQAAREADSWANVTGELDETMHQLQATLGAPVLEALIPVIQQLTAGIQAMTEEADWKVLNDSIDDFSASMENADKQLSAARTEISSTAIMAQTYVKRLTELEQAGLDNASAQEEYRRTVELLNETIPGLNVTINEHTGHIDQSTASILANVEAWKAEAVAQAEAERMSSMVRSYAEAEVALNDATAQRTTIEGQLKAVEAQLLAMGVDITKGTAKQATSFGLAGDAAGGFAQDIIMLNSEEGRLRAEHGKLLAEQARLDEEIAAGTETLAEWEGQIDSTVEASEELKEATAQTTEEVDLVAEAYAAAKEEARASIDSQIGLFDQLSTESSMSAQEIIENWQAQQQAFLNYEDNLKKAVDMGLDEALVRQLADGSEQSMAILNEFVNGTEASIDEINAAFRGRLDAEDSVAGEMARVEQALESKKDNLYNQAYEGGKNISEGTADGMNDYAYLVDQAADRIARAPSKVITFVNQMKSPSRLMMSHGRNIVEGLAIGVDEKAKRLEKSMEDLALSGNQAYLDERISSMEALPASFGYPGMAGGTTNTYTTNFGGVTLQIYQQPGEDAQDLAYRVMDLIQAEVEQQEVALYG